MGDAKYFGEIINALKIEANFLYVTSNFNYVACIDCTPHSLQTHTTHVSPRILRPDRANFSPRQHQSSPAQHLSPAETNPHVFPSAPLIVNKRITVSGWAMMGDLQQASPIPANIPRGIVTEWTVTDVQNWLSQSLQLPQYLEQFESTFLTAFRVRVLGPANCRKWNCRRCACTSGPWCAEGDGNHVGGTSTVPFEADL